MSWTPGNNWNKTTSGYRSPCGHYDVSARDATTDDGSNVARSKPYWRLRRDGARLGMLHRSAKHAAAAAERDARARAV